MIFIINIILTALYMTGWFVIGRSKNRLDVADVGWGGGFVIVAFSSFLVRPTPWTIIILILVTIWGCRLAYHISKRNSGKAPDPRYLELSSRWPANNFWVRAYFSVFLTQALLIFLVSLPITLAATKSIPLRFLALGGVVLWLTGFLFEVLADRQLARFISNPANKGQIMQQGLWRYSRHPNYFGEIVLWWGIAALAFGASGTALVVIGPIVITILLVFVSGIPPIERRYKNNSKYQQYAIKTSILVPWPVKS